MTSGRCAWRHDFAPGMAPVVSSRHVFRPAHAVNTNRHDRSREGRSRPDAFDCFLVTAKVLPNATGRGPKRYLIRMSPWFHFMQHQLNFPHFVSRGPQDSSAVWCEWWMNQPQGPGIHPGSRCMDRPASFRWKPRKRYHGITERSELRDSVITLARFSTERCRISRHPLHGSG